MLGRTVALAIEAGEEGQEATARARSVLGPDAQVVLDGRHLFAAFLADGPRSNLTGLRALARRAAQAVASSQARRTDWIGMGFSVPMDAAGARAKALTALDLGKVLWREPRVVSYEDVCIFDALQKDRRLLQLLAALLDPLLAYDDENATELVPTLEAFYEADLSQVTTARRLDVHRHTVSARLRLTEKILGRPVRSGPDRLLFEFAPKAKRLLHHGPYS